MFSDVRWLPDFACNQRLLLAWPYRRDVWRQHAQPARQAITELIQTLPQDTPLSLVVAPELWETVPEALQSTPRMAIPYDDIWLRDTAPLWAVRAQETHGLRLRFDGWSGVQGNIADDQRVAERLYGHTNTSFHGSEFIAEGGNFTHNGQGDWLIGLACLKQRNLGWSEQHLKASVRQLLPNQRIVFFDGALSADETGGHIDNMALFVSADTLVYAFTDDENHPDYATCQALQTCLQQLPETIRKVALPLPSPQWPQTDDRQNIELSDSSLKRTLEVPLLLSYVNTLFAGSVVVVPQFGLPSDALVLRRMQSILPERTVVGLDAREFTLGGGGLHCISHNAPEHLFEPPASL